MIYDPRQTIKDKKDKPVCDHVGCEEEAKHRAPKSRDNLREYYWFCLKHVREYNRSWNYFEDMSEDQISTYRHNTATWHRPTWDLGKQTKESGVHGQGFTFEEPFGLFNEETQQKTNLRRRTTTTPVAKALNIMNLEPNSTPSEIKTRYKELAKKFHPDLNGGSKQAEERLKRINEAYSLLLSSGYA
tara:strand:+ start:133 stop:693 length:561 start_codon:yes stop_codon:yes gene_type:complete